MNKSSEESTCPPHYPNNFDSTSPEATPFPHLPLVLLSPLRSNCINPNTSPRRTSTFSEHINLLRTSNPTARVRMDDIKMISQNDDFDRLPDDLLRLILNRIHDAKSLCACLAVSTRFNSLAIHSTNLSLSVDRIYDSDDDDSSDLHHSASNHNLLRSIFKLLISKPFRFLTNLASSRTDDSSSATSAVFYSPTQALKSFSNIEILKIMLPSHGELQLDRASNPLLKWKANFASELKSCVIVAATSVDQFTNNPDSNDDDQRRRGSEIDVELRGNNKEEHHHRAEGIDRAEQLPPPPPPFAISNEDLKMRVVWTISCLIAASSRHQLLKRIVLEHPMLKSIEVVDDHHQGTLTMDDDDILQMRTGISNADSSSSTEGDDDGDGERSRIPALKMKMWQAAELELPGCKKVMRGATLVVIGAAINGVGVGVGEEEVFEEEEEEEEMMYGEAAKEIRRKMKRSYSLEMESF